MEDTVSSNPNAEHVNGRAWIVLWRGGEGPPKRKKVKINTTPTVKILKTENIKDLYYTALLLEFEVVKGNQWK